MTINIGIVMDPISTITTKKDTTFAMMLEAQKRSWSIYYMQQKDIYFKEKQVHAKMNHVTVKDDPASWYEILEQQHKPLSDLHVILMRKDPPFDIEYIYTTYLLELAEKEGVLIVNKPQGLRDMNEKLITSWFPQCCPPTIVTRDKQLLQDFLKEHQHVIFKPLEGMGGRSVFQVTQHDPNINVIIENLTHDGTHYIMGQQYIPDIKKTGDKRILLIDGKPIPYALARIPQENETRGNLAVGAKGVGIELSERDYWICEQVAETLQKKGILFAGIDVIGDYLTEINVTSPTCIRELDAAYQLNIGATFLDCIEKRL